jgi:hypothetical protein
VRATSRIGGPGKAAQILEEGNGSLEREREGRMEGAGEQGQCQELTQSESRHQNVRKNTAHKEQGLMTGSSCQAGQGKMAQH